MISILVCVSKCLEFRLTYCDSELEPIFKFGRRSRRKVPVVLNSQLKSIFMRLPSLIARK